MKTRQITLLLLTSFLSLSFNSRAAVYKESGGIVVVEAEHFDARTTNADGHHWAIMPDENGKPDTAADPGFANARGGKASSEDAFGFQELNGSTTPDQTQINIVDSTTPLAAGLPKGLVTVSTPEPYSQGTPEGAHVVATLATDPSQAVIYYYEKGEKGFNGFVMPARRVFFFFGDNTASVATAEGLKLFDAAVDWLLGGQVVPPPKPAFTKVAKTSSDNLTLEWTGSGTLQSASSITCPWTDVANASSPYSTAIAGAPMKFYRLKK